jgi:hypothetical protein
MGPTNAADGCPPVGPILIHFGVDILPSQLTGQNDIPYSLDPSNPIALFDWDSGAPVIFMSEMDENRKANYPNRYALIIRPLDAMQPAHRHIVVLTKALQDANGNPLQSPPAFAALRDGVLTDNAEIEGVRPHYEELFTFLAEQGIPRDSLLLAWDFMVASEDFLLGSILSMRTTTLQEVLGTGLAYTIDSVQQDPNENIARIVEGNFLVPTYLTADNVFVYDEQHHPEPQAGQYFPYTMLIPKMAETAESPLPLVIFGHGLFGTGRDYLTGGLASVIQPLVEENGVVMVATDWIGLSAGDLDLILKEVLPDFNMISLVTDRLQQSLINNITLTELSLGNLSHDPQVQIGDQQLVDPAKVYYYGVSLGGIQGTSFVSLSNRITRGVLADAGSGWMNMIPRSTNWTIIKLAADAYYPDPLLQQMLIAIIQTRFDLSDPINLSRLMYKEPLPDAPPNRLVVVQEAYGDCQVPNLTTEMLARQLGLYEMIPSITSVYGLNTIASPSPVSTLTQYNLTWETSQYMPPQTNVPPSEDNGAHHDMPLTTNALEQTSQMLMADQIVQYCTGACILLDDDTSPD